MTDLTSAEKAMQTRNTRLGLALAAFVLFTILLAIYNFYNHGLPKDPNRMRERFQKQTAEESQHLPPVLQTDKSEQTPVQSKEAP